MSKEDKAVIKKEVREADPLKQGLKQTTTTSDIDRLLKAANDPLAGVLASGGAFLTGIGLLMDDAKDFGELISTWSPKDVELRPHPHHWIGGILLMMGGAAGMGFNLLRLVQENPPPPKMPQSLLEGAASETLETYR